MNKLAWIRRLTARLRTPCLSRRVAPAARPRPSLCPGVEALEDRWVPATFTVLNNNDTGTGSLRQAVLDANATPGADTITFSPTINGQTIALATALPPITDTLTITGPGPNGITVTGNNAVSLFTINAGVAATISGLTLTGGKAAADGGALLNANGIVTLDNDILQNNTAAGAGGAVANEGANAQLTVTNSTFRANSAATSGGALFSTTAGARLTITNSAFSSNTAQEGGAIRAGTGTTSTNTGAAITGNSGATNGDGAGIRNDGTMTISATTVALNTGLGVFDGGGIRNDGSLALTNSAVYGNLSQGTGGGIFSAGTLLTISNSTVANNTALAGIGGGGISVNAGSLALLNDTVTDNVDASQAATNAGGVSFTGAGTFTLNNTIVAQNFATGAAPQPQDIRGTVASGVNNLIGIDTGLVGLVNGANGNQVGTVVAPLDPKLGPPQDNGGPTFSRKPLLGGPVINAGNNAAAATLTTDQRGFLRIVGGTVDIGAVEFQPPQVTVTLTISPTAPIPFRRAVTLSATVAPASAAPNNPVTGTVTFLVNGTTVLGTATLDNSGKASLTTAAAVPLPLGADQITARYDGDNNYASALSAAITQQVLRPTTTPGVFDPATAT
jgi:hypothetical protein